MLGDMFTLATLLLLSSATTVWDVSEDEDAKSGVFEGIKPDGDVFLGLPLRGLEASVMFSLR